MLADKLRAASFKPTAAPSFVASAITTNAAAGTQTANLPTRQAGDFLVLFANIRGNTTTMSTPAGWTAFLTNAATPVAGAFYRTATNNASDTATFSISTSLEFNAVCISIRNYSSTNTIGAWAATDTSSPLTNSGITPTASGLLLGYWAIRPTGSTATVNVTSGPSGMTSAGTPTQQGLSAAAYYKDQPATSTGALEISLDTATIAGSHSLLIQLA